MAVAFLGLLFWSSQSGAGSWQQPLDDRTRQQLGNVATTYVQQLDNSIFTRTNGVSKTVALPPQVLLIERVESKQATSDTVEIFVYSYQSQQTTRHLVNAVTGIVLHSDTVPQVSLPLNADETRYVMSLLQSNTAINDALDHDHLTQLGIPFSGWHTIDAKVSIWIPDNTDSAAAQSCNQQRCALVTLFNGGHYNFSVEPVVNLNTGTVFPDVTE